MQDQETGTFWREDTMFGVCQALGEDFGFNPIWPRMMFALGLLWMPVTMICVYFGIGLVVLASRLLSPNPRPVARAGADAAPATAANEGNREPLPIAA